MAGLWLFFLAVTAPMLLWAFWMAKDLLSGPGERRREAARLAEIVAIRRRYVGMASGDPGAYESLGDALRSAGHAREALDAFESASKLAENAPQGLSSNGWLAGSGLESKLRLIRLEIAQEANPAGFGLTMATREIVCPLCRNLSPPKTLECWNCGHALPVDSLADAWTHLPFRKQVLTDATGFFWKVLIVGIVLACTLAIPEPAVQAATILAAAIVLAALFLKRLGNPES